MKARVAVLFVLVCFVAKGQEFEGLKHINGTSLYFKIIGRGEPLVIVHGGPGMNHTYFLPHLDALAKKYRVIFYDQRASGRSAIPATDSISLKFFADDLEAIRKDLGVEKLNLLAHSWGAIPAINYGIQYPARINRLILCAPVPLSKDFDSQMLEYLKSVTTSRDSTDRSIILGSKEFKSGNPEGYRKLLLLAFRHSFYKPANSARLNIQVRANYLKAGNALMTGLSKELEAYNYYDTIKSFGFPVLIMHGAVDGIPREASTLTQQKMPRATLQVFKKSGHFIFIEEPRKFNASVVSFLQGK